METLLQIPVELTGSQTKSISKTTKLTFESQENVPPELISRITGSVGKTGWLCFLPEERQIDTLDVIGLPEISVEKGEKTPGQRMRAVIWRIWEKGGKTGDFITFYSSKMEQIIEHLKEKLD